MNHSTETPLIRIVDDDDAILTSVSFLLRQEGYEVKTWANPLTYFCEDQPSRPAVSCSTLKCRNSMDLKYNGSLPDGRLLLQSFSFLLMVILKQPSIP